MKDSTLRTGGPRLSEFDPRPRRVFPDGRVEYLELPERKRIELIGLKKEFFTKEDRIMKTTKISNEVILKLHGRYAAGETIKALAAEVELNPMTLRTYFQASGLAYPIKQTTVKAEAEKVEPSTEMVFQKARAAAKKVERTSAPFDVLTTVAACEAAVKALNLIEGCRATFRFRYEVQVGEDEPGPTPWWDRTAMNPPGFEVVRGTSAAKEPDHA